MNSSSSETQRRLLQNCKIHAGPLSGAPRGIACIDEIYMHGDEIILYMVDEEDNDMVGVNFEYIIAGACELIRSSHPNDAKEIREQTLASLRAAIIAVERQACES